LSHDADESKLPKRLHASPPARELDRESKGGSLAEEVDSDIEESKPGLHLRKRTKRGRDFTLKQAIVVIEHLKSKHEQLTARTQAPGLHLHRPGATPVASIDHKPSDPVLSGASLLHGLHEQAFYQCPESRLLCRLSLLDHQHIVMDCNDAWANAMGRSRSELVGRRLSDLYCPASVHRFELNVQLALHHQVIVTRNMLSVECGLVVDMVSWVDPCQALTSDAVRSGNTMHGEVPAYCADRITPGERESSRYQYMHMVHMNARPWKLPAVSPASLLGQPEATSVSPASSVYAGHLATAGDAVLLPVSRTGLPVLHSTYYDTFKGDEHLWEQQPLVLASIQRLSSANLDDKRSDMDDTQEPGYPVAPAAYPECTIFMPMDLPDMPQADLYLLPWNHASSAHGGGVPGFHTSATTPPASGAASLADAFPLSSNTSNTCELLDLTYSPALTSLQRSVVAKAYMRSSSVPDTEVTRLLSPCVTTRATAPRLHG